MKTILSTLFSCLFMLGTANAGVLLTVENRSLDGSQPERVASTIAIDGNRVRIDHTEPGRSSRGSVIYRGDRKQMIVLNHEGSSFQIVTQDSLKHMNQQINDQVSAMMEQMKSKLAQLPPAQRQMVEQMMQQQNPAAMGQPAAPQPPPAQVKKTGETKTVRGYPTVQYEVYENGDRVREMWVTDWASAGVKRDDFRIFKEMHQFQQQAFSSMNSGQGLQTGDAAFDEFRQVEGLPVVVTNYNGPAKVRETSLQSVEQKAFQDSYFEPPANYQQSQGFSAPPRLR